MSVSVKIQRLPTVSLDRSHVYRFSVTLALHSCYFLKKKQFDNGQFSRAIETLDIESCLVSTFITIVSTSVKRKRKITTDYWLSSSPFCNVQV